MDHDKMKPVRRVNGSLMSRGLRTWPELKKKNLKLFLEVSAKFLKRLIGGRECV